MSTAATFDQGPPDTFVDLGTTDDEGTITTMEALTVTGATYRQVDYWCRMGFIPGAQNVVGSGNRRHFTYEQVQRIRRLKAAADILAMGLSELADTLP